MKFRGVNLVLVIALPGRRRVSLTDPDTDNQILIKFILQESLHHPESNGSIFMAIEQDSRPKVSSRWPTASYVGTQLSIFGRTRLVSYHDVAPSSYPVSRSLLLGRLCHECQGHRHCL
jgi:hypothetical protein